MLIFAIYFTTTPLMMTFRLPNPYSSKNNFGDQGRFDNHSY